MIRQVNPYQTLSFYATDTPAALLGAIHSPVNSLPPFQLFIADDAETISEWKLRKVDNPLVSAMQDNALLTIATVPGSGVFVVYAGTDLDNAPVAGEYQVVITTTSGAIYYSHKLCLSRAFDTFTASGLTFNDGDCITDGGGTNFILPFTATFPEWGQSAVYLDVNQTGSFVYISALSEFELTQENLSEFGADAIIRIETYYVLPNEPGALHRAYRDWIFSFAEGDPCGGTLTVQGAATEIYSEQALVLRWGNASDLQNLNLLYQTGWEQAFYFYGYRAEYVPVVEESYDETGEGTRFLEQAVFIEEQAFALHPAPDYLFEVLRTAQAHDTVTLETFNGDAITLHSIVVEKTEVQGSDVPGAILRFQLPPVAVQGCEANFEIA